MRLLIIEDSRPLRTALASGLRSEGFAVDVAADGEEGLWLARENPYDAILLDLLLPGIDGREILARLRGGGSTVPVLVLSARDSVEDRVHGLDLGADDYMVKPFAFDELLARIRALVRRGYQDARPQLLAGGLRFDPARQAVEVDGQAVGLSPRERALLELLLRRKGQYVGRAELHEHLYAFDEEPESNVIAVTLCSLRRKLRQAGCPDLITSRRRLGYRLLDSPT